MYLNEYVLWNVLLYNVPDSYPNINYLSYLLSTGYGIHICQMVRPYSTTVFGE